MEKESDEQQTDVHAIDVGIGSDDDVVVAQVFNAIFNVADMAISTGVGILIVFNKKAFHNQE